MKLVAEAMNRAVVTIDPGLSLQDAADVLRRTGAEHLLVVDEANLVGILCGCDLRGARPEGAVSERMSPPGTTVRPDAEIEEAVSTLAGSAARCVPVAVGGLLLGTLSEAELERAGVEPARASPRCGHRQRRRVRVPGN